MKRINTISYLHRHGVRGDLPAAPKLVLASHILKKYGFSIGDQVTVNYQKNSIIINKLTKK